jgi:hypothetical protein
MNRSLSDYIINSSRNTLKYYNYDPAYSTSETVFAGLANLLEKGVRYIEVDIWVGFIIT